MSLERRQSILLVCLAMALVVGAWGIWHVVRPDGVAALRSRLLGESAGGVIALLGEPAFRLNGDRQWHYMDDVLLRQFTDSSTGNATLIVEFSDDQVVNNVYLE